VVRRPGRARRGIVIGLTALAAALPAWAAFEDLESGVRPQGMGGAFTAVADDPSAIHWNPAGLAALEEIELIALYKHLFGGPEGLHNATLDVALPTRWGHFGASLQEVGFELESERVLTLSGALQLTEDLAVGLNAVGYQLYQKRFGTGLAVGFDVGLLATVYRRWRLGFFAHNLNNPTLGADYRYDLPRLVNVGLAYIPFEGVISSLDLSKEVGKGTRLQAGQEFAIFDDLLVLRAGIQTEPARYSAGLGTRIERLRFDYAVQNHEVLPLTHQVSFGYRF
jgi:hypothetical protein